MASLRVVEAAVRRAVETARVDAAAPREPRDERCRFDPEALAAVLRLCDSPAGVDVALDLVDQVLQECVETLDADRTFAAVVLRERVDRATARHQVEVENVQGDVGTGHGLVVDDDQQ
jgi:hypothetical protein